MRLVDAFSRIIASIDGDCHHESLWFGHTMRSWRRNVDSSICAAFKSHFEHARRPLSSRSSSRIPSKTLDWPSTGCIHIAIRYAFDHVEKRMRGHLLPGRSHLRVVARALKVAARQIARDVRWKWLIGIGSSVIPCVQSFLGMLPQLNRGRKAACLHNRHVFANYSEWINHRSTPRFAGKISG